MRKSTRPPAATFAMIGGATMRIMTMKMETVVSIVVVLSEGVVVEADEADEVVSIPLCVTRRPASCRPASCCQGTL